MSISIFIEEHTPRIQYAIELIFKTVLGVQVNIISKESEQEIVHISYSCIPKKGSIHILPHGLLNSTGYEAVQVNMGSWGQLKTLFPQNEQKVPFDIFSASFYLATRYEEYNPQTKRDHHNRFMAKESLAFKENFLHLPLIELWALELKNLMVSEFKDLKFPAIDYQFISTFDIDNAFAFKHKSFNRQFLSTCRDIAYGRWEHLYERLRTTFGAKDPYDTFDYIKRNCEENKIDARVFFLLNSNGKFDRSVSPRKKIISKKIALCETFAEVGIHPSYEASENLNVLAHEFNTFEKISGKRPIISRNHYLKLELPKSYKQANNLNIKEEHTLGYAEEPGFRASISKPFYFYNIENEKQNSVLTVPFIVMDTTLRLYKGLSPNQALSFIQELLKQVKTVNGSFSIIWHNESLCNKFEWKDWRSVFETICKQEASKL